MDAISIRTHVRGLQVIVQAENLDIEYLSDLLDFSQELSAEILRIALPFHVKRDLREKMSNVESTLLDKINSVLA